MDGEGLTVSPVALSQVQTVSADQMLIRTDGIVAGDSKGLETEIWLTWGELSCALNIRLR